MTIEVDSHPAIDVGQGSENLESNVTENTSNDEVETNQAETEQSDVGNENQESEYIETEFEGEMYKLPKKLKDALLRQSDYTKKTTELANQRKEFETRNEEFLKRSEEFERAQQEFQKSAQLREANFKKAAQIQNIEQQLELYNQLDWNSFDPQQANTLDREHRLLQEQRNKLYRELNDSENQRIQTEQQTLAKREEETRRILQNDIPNWNLELQDNLVKYAKELGAKESDIQETLKHHPEQVKLLRKAYLYDKLQKEALAKPIKEVKPVPKVSSGNTMVSKDPREMSQSEYSQWRQKRLKAS